jgi:ABC-2 type transport system permease protein
MRCRTLAGFSLRKDRLKISIWLIGTAVLPAGIAASFARLYPDRASRLPFAAGIAANAGLRALTGPAQDLTTLGGLTSWRGMGVTCVFAGLMGILQVLRQTRAEEESGRLELLRSAPVAAADPLGAALVTALIVNLALAVLIALGLIGAGLPAGGAFGFGLAVGACGMTFAALAAVAAQLTEITRPATAIASAALAGAYLLRAVGDSSGPSWLSWLSPIGWAQQSRPFGSERAWTPLLSLGLAGLLAWVAFRLAAHRDFGSGLLAARPGPPRAHRLSSSLALAWRLQRAALGAWAIGFAVLGVVVGALANSVGDLVEDSPQLADVLTALGGEQSVVDSYLGTVFGVCGLMAGVYTVSALLRLSTEEAEGRAETLLATPVGRRPWAVGHLAIALAGAAALMLVAGMVTGMAYSLVSTEGELPRILLAALSQTFAAWVFAGLGLLLFGARPSATLLSWAAIGLAAVLQLLGPALDLPQIVLDVSPYTHLPTLPGDEFTIVPWLWLTGVTTLLAGGGLITLDRRDLT